MRICGFVSISVEGFFVERFMNLCLNQGIFLWDITREKNTFVRVKLSTSDFKKIKSIARKTKCRIKIERKTGIPFLIHNYRKRKAFLIALIILFFLAFTISKFIWNIEILGLDKIEKEEIQALLLENGIEVGKLKSKVNVEEAVNNIRLKEEKIGWIGIKIKGTNVIVEVVETVDKPEVIDENEICNIVAKEDATISKIIVQNGTAKVNVGDKVHKGDILVEGVMEGVYTRNKRSSCGGNCFRKNRV
jgi:similar to stage IV sporulation protein